MLPAEPEVHSKNDNNLTFITIFTEYFYFYMDMGSGKTKILIIDDETSVLEALQIFLEQEGYAIEAADKYADYLAHTDAKDMPDIIILDILLMDEDGRDIARKLKNSAKTKHIPIIMISAHPGAEHTAIRAGADAFLSKPFEIGDLLKTIDRLVTA